LSLAKSLAATNASFIGITVMRLVSTAIVARIISPDEMGVWTLGFAIVGIFQIVRDLGTSAYIHTAITLTDDDVRTCNGLQALMGLGFFIIFWFAAPFLASFYKDNRVAEALRISVFSFLIIPFSASIYGSFVRSGRFTLKSGIDFVAQFFLYGGSIVLAFQGFSHLTAPIAVLISQVVVVITCWVFRSKTFPIGWSLVNWRTVGSKSGTALSISLVQHVSDRGGDFVLPKTQGFAQSAFYEKGVNILELVKMVASDMFGPILISNLRKVAKETPDQFSLTAANSLYIIFLVAALGCTFVAFNASAIVLTLFGSNWLPAIASMKILALALPLAAVNSVLVKIFYILDKHSTALKVVVFGRAVLFISLVIASFYDLRTVAIAVVAAETLLFTTTLYIARDFVSLKKMFANIFGDLALLISVSFLSFYLLKPLGQLVPIIQVLISGSLYLGLLAVGFYLFRQDSLAVLKTALLTKQTSDLPQ
jgi:lipopolysaccharide exporter